MRLFASPPRMTLGGDPIVGVIEGPSAPSQSVRKTFATRLFGLPFGRLANSSVPFVAGSQNVPVGGTDR